MRKLIECLLGDEHGISEDSYNALVAVLRAFAKIPETELEASILLERTLQADATDGRFYFSE